MVSDKIITQVQLSDLLSRMWMSKSPQCWTAWVFSSWP